MSSVWRKLVMSASILVLACSFSLTAEVVLTAARAKTVENFIVELFFCLLFIVVVYY